MITDKHLEDLYRKLKELSYICEHKFSNKDVAILIILSSFIGFAIAFAIWGPK